MTTVTLQRIQNTQLCSYILKVNNTPIYEWYLRPKQEDPVEWTDSFRVKHILSGTRYKNPVRSYPCIIGKISMYKLGSTLSISQIYQICTDFGVLLDELDADLRQLGWGQDINKYYLTGA